MSRTDKHLAWLRDTGKTLTTACGKKVPILELQHQSDQAILSAWAKHFRNHYCLDSEIDLLRRGTPYSRGDYLRTIKFPDRTVAPGPSIRSGDLAEILVADYVQYVLKYWVPRTRYGDKASRNESTKGTDILGFKRINPKKESRKDKLALFEAKAQLSAAAQSARLQDAVIDSVKDEVRKAESLNAVKQRLFASNNAAGMALVERFQDPEGRPYTEEYGAAAVFSTAAFNDQIECKTDTSNHPHRDKLLLLVIRGNDLMALVHDLYERAANEA